MRVCWCIPQVSFDRVEELQHLLLSLACHQLPLLYLESRDDLVAATQFWPEQLIDFLKAADRR